jgi:hypothetical protein
MDVCVHLPRMTAACHKFLDGALLFHLLEKSYIFVLACESTRFGGALPNSKLIEVLRHIKE